MKVTIIGAGNAGFVHAAKLIERGVEVCICKTYDVLHSVIFTKVESQQGFDVIDVTNDNRAFFARPALITDVTAVDYDHRIRIGKRR